MEAEGATYGWTKWALPACSNKEIFSYDLGVEGKKGEGKESGTQRARGWAGGGFWEQLPQAPARAQAGKWRLQRMVLWGQACHPSRSDALCENEETQRQLRKPCSSNAQRPVLQI